MCTTEAAEHTGKSYRFYFLNDLNNLLVYLVIKNRIWLSLIEYFSRSITSKYISVDEKKNVARTALFVFFS